MILCTISVGEDQSPVFAGCDLTISDETLALPYQVLRCSLGRKRDAEGLAVTLGLLTLIDRKS